MHAALPGSFGNAHSMSDWAQGEKSGREVYEALWHAQNVAHKKVYLLASHSHFYMAGIFASDYLKQHGGVLPGWIVGTAGAVRYPLPPLANKAEAAMTNVYGYLLGTVAADGTIKFEFKQVKEQDIPPSVAAQYTPEGLHYCVAENPRPPQ